MLNNNDKDLYQDLIKLLTEIKLVQGNIALNRTINNHPRIRDFLIDSQILALSIFENSL